MEPSARVQPSSVTHGPEPRVVRAHPVSFYQEIWVTRLTTDGKMEVLQNNGEVRTLLGHKEETEPTFCLPQDVFSKLVEVLTAGRPYERPYTEGKLEGTERHLQDLRKLLKL